MRRNVSGAMTRRVLRAVTAVFAGLAVFVVMLPAAAEPRPGTDESWEETSPGFVVPNDPLLREQWWLFNFGQEIGGQVTGQTDADIRAPEAWAITQGVSDVVVAVLDTGIDYDHPEFDGQLWTNPGEMDDGRESNGVDDDGNGYIDDWRGWDFADGDNDPLDEDGHGTHVAGVIAAKGGDALGITGVAPGSRILPLRVAGEGGRFDLTITPAAIEYAAASGARVVVQSYTTDPSGLFDQSDAETATMLAHPEILFVTGAGNDGNDYRDFAGRAGALKPCNNPTVPNLICVAGTDRNDDAWEESTFGAGRIQIAAPAESMLVVARPKQFVVEDGFAVGEWAPAGDMSGFWAASGAPPEFTFEDGDADDGGRVVHITHRPPDDSPSVGVLRLADRIDLTGHTGCNVEFEASGTLGSATAFGIGLFRESDGRANAFGGERSVIPNEMSEAGDDYVAFSFPVRSHEPLEVALKVETRRSADNQVDVRVRGFRVVCWNSEHGERDYEYWAGTSFATPLVAGVAALVASATPELDPLLMRQAILESAVVLPSLSGLVETGGRVDAYGALERAAELADGGASAPSSGASFGPSRAGAASGAPVSFGSHDDYEQPAAAAVRGVPTERGGPDPALETDSDEANAGADAGGASDDARSTDEVSDPAQAEDDSGGIDPAVFAILLALAAAGLLAGGLLAWIRSRANAAQAAELERVLSRTLPAPDDAMLQLERQAGVDGEEEETFDDVLHRAVEKRHLYRESLKRHSYAELDAMYYARDGYWYNGYEAPPERADFPDAESYEDAKFWWDKGYEVFKKDLIEEYNRKGAKVDIEIAIDRTLRETKEGAVKMATDIWEAPGRVAKQLGDAYWRWWSDVESWWEEHTYPGNTRRRR